MHLECRNQARYCAHERKGRLPSEKGKIDLHTRKYPISFGSESSSSRYLTSLRTIPYRIGKVPERIFISRAIELCPLELCSLIVHKKLHSSALQYRILTLNFLKKANRSKQKPHCRFVYHVCKVSNIFINFIATYFVKIRSNIIYT